MEHTQALQDARRDKPALAAVQQDGEDLTLVVLERSDLLVKPLRQCV